LGLQVYHRKRKFDVTPEPRGRTAKTTAKTKGDRFVIQKHAARRLHYDFRLELDGVMKSWAVTRGPSLVPGEKRLAVHVEDHPIEYNKFEGTIPEGEYGGGTVMIWDRGRWCPDGDPHQGLKKGRVTFTLEGEKLHGKWHLVRMHGRRNGSKENWLLIKAHDEWERGPRDTDILEEMPLSAASGRSMEEIAAGKGKKRVWHSNRSTSDNVKAGAAEAAVATRRTGRKKARSARRSTATAKKGARKSKHAKDLGKGGSALPDFVPPSLATLAPTAPSGEGWVHEIKFDGYRLLARIDRGRVTLKTRSGLDWTAKFASVQKALQALPVVTAFLDGEVAVQTEGGTPSFAAVFLYLSIVIVLPAVD
jgi:bifunctional non-homologous end joining protein LigD